MKTMKAVQIARRGGPLELVERLVPEPGPGQVRIKVESCGICHGELVAIEGHHPLMQYPRIPGHEVIGVIDKLGPLAGEWSVGDRVGVGWSGGGHEVTGLTYDGGYAEYMIGFAARMTRIPAGLPSAEASPLMCAGVTTFGALKHSVAGPGDTVAILGIGGLGHMALQYARNSGFRTVAVSRGGDKKGLALELGAHVYIDAQSEDPVQILKGMGGARVILATAPDSASITRIFDGLGEGGEMIIVAGMGGNLEFAPGQFLAGRRAVRGFTGTDPADLAGTLNFSQLANIHPLIETFPLDQAAGAFDRMMSSNVRFRAVLTM